MKAWQVTQSGEFPHLANLPEPIPAEGEVLVEITAAGLNFADLLMIEGRYQDTPPLPFVPGMEIAGRVIGHGPGVTHPAIGSRVAVFCGHGGLAERAAFPAVRCRLIPQAMPDAEAAGFMIAYGSSHLALKRRAGLKAGETLVVLGAAGGVGMTAVEIGAAMGARVIGVARGGDRQAAVRAAGATLVLDAEADLAAALKDLGGYDVLYDPVGGAAFKAAMRAARPEARLLPIGFASGEVPQIPANVLLVKNLTVLGFYWGGYLRFAPEVLGESLDELMGWYVEGRLSPHIGAKRGFDDLPEALTLLRDRKVAGKVVIERQISAVSG